MERYNKRDVILLEAIYLKLKPWMKPVKIKELKAIL
jgi:hypothetical protein